MIEKLIVTVINHCLKNNVGIISRPTVSLRWCAVALTRRPTFSL